SASYAKYMKDYLGIPAQRIAVVPLGVNLSQFGEAPTHRDAADSSAPFTIGFFARVAPEKGLHVLAQAFIRLRKMTDNAPIRLEAAGYLAPAHEAYPGEVRQLLAEAGLLE